MAWKVSKSHVEEIKELQKAEKEGKSSSTQKSRLSELRKYYSKQREWATGKTEKNVSTGGSGDYWKPEKGRLISKETVKKSIEGKSKSPNKVKDYVGKAPGSSLVGVVRDIVGGTYISKAPRFSPVGILRDITKKKVGSAGGSKGKKK